MFLRLKRAEENGKYESMILQSKFITRTSSSIIGKSEVPTYVFP